MNRRSFSISGLSLAAAPQLLQAQTPEATPTADTSKRRVIAGSESSTNGDLPVDHLFGEWVGEGNKALYLPIAAPDTESRTPQKADRVWNAISQAGVSDLDTWLYADIEAEGFVPDFSEYGGVYIGDGDPHTLLSGLHDNGLFEPLRAACDNGTVLYGTSSGSMVLGANIMYSVSPHRLDQSNLASEESEGLSVIHAEDGSELVLAPHFRNTRTDVWERLVEETGYTVALIRDGSALTLNEGVLEDFGADPVVWIS